jgi:hypothetical protein
VGRPEKPVDVSGGLTAQFAGELRRLREDAGSPTYRDMAHCALYSPSVLSSAASGQRLPTLPVTLAYVRACGGDVEKWRHLWFEAQEAQQERTGPLGKPKERSAGSLVRPARSARSAGSLVRPAQLPPRSHVFTGRRGELHQLIDGRPAAGSVVISGPAGSGKSELALAYAHHLVPEMVDGQLYTDLGYNAPACAGAHTVTDGFLHALGVPVRQLPAAADQRISCYRTLFAQRRILVLLENACCERQIRPLLAESRFSVTIVVCRAPLHGLSGVRRIRVDVLPRADSVAYIAGVLPRRAREEPAMCDQLAALCADLPFALDVATRKLAARPALSLHRAVDRLRVPHKMLDWLRIGDLSVRELLDTVYAQLDDAARALLCHLARSGGDLLAPGCVHRAIVAPPGDDDQYEQLAEAGMLRWGASPGTYRVDPLVRAFVSDLFRQSRSEPVYPDQGSLAERALMDVARTEHPLELGG